MKASMSPRARAFAVAVLLAAGMLPGVCQDTLTLVNGQVQEGKITGVSEGNVRIKVGPAETAQPLAQVKSATMVPPGEFQAAMEAWAKRDGSKAISLLVPLTKQYGGLPARWVERASATLGEAYLAEGKLPEAEAVIGAFEKTYPDSKSEVDLARATIALSKNDLKTVRERVEPIVAEAKGVKLASPDKSAVYGQAYYLMGQVHESEKKYPEALRDYLTTVTLFHEDAAALARAQERADVLVKEKLVVVP